MHIYIHTSKNEGDVMIACVHVHAHACTHRHTHENDGGEVLSREKEERLWINDSLARESVALTDKQMWWPGRLSTAGTHMFILKEAVFQTQRQTNQAPDRN